MIITGVGSRETPRAILLEMEQIAKVLSTHSHIIRSGGADGADSAFARGFRMAPNYIESNLEEYIPGRWDMFKHVKNPIVLDTVGGKELAKKYHAYWNSMKYGGQQLHGRNTHQVLGKDLARPKPCDVVICWTKDGCRDHATRTRDTGGTGTAISLGEKEAHALIINMRLSKFDTALKVLAMLDNYYTLMQLCSPTVAVKNADMWKLCDANEEFIPCITTNQIVKSSGELVMGAGNALDAARRYPQLPRMCGEMVGKFGECRGLLNVKGHKVYIFPTKVDYRNPSLTSYVWDSAIHLGLTAMDDSKHTYLLPQPGCGLGKLDWNNDVEPILRKTLPDNVWILTNKGLATLDRNAVQTCRKSVLDV